MSKKRKSNYPPDKYWKDKYNYDYDEEFYIYKYLCGKIKKKEQNKVVFKFNRYASWENYILDKYQSINPLEFQEFCKYLNGKKRNSGIYKNMIYIYIIPTISAIISGIITSSITGNKNENIMGLIATTTVVIVLWGIGFVYATRTVLNEAMEAETNKNFYEDFIEIIKKIHNEY